MVLAGCVHLSIILIDGVIAVEPYSIHKSNLTLFLFTMLIKVMLIIATSQEAE